MGYEEALQEVSKHQKNSVAVLVSSGAVLTSWTKGAGAVLAPLLPGQEYGKALAELLFGESNPSGRLPITLPNIDNEIGFTPEQYPGVNQTAAYSERLEVGYRW